MEAFPVSTACGGSGYRHKNILVCEYKKWQIYPIFKTSRYACLFFFSVNMNTAKYN